MDRLSFSGKVIRRRAASKKASKCSARPREAFLDPTGLVPVVNEVEWFRRPRPHSTVASTVIGAYASTDLVFSQTSKGPGAARTMQM